jgi:hypothetical protein
MPMNLALFSGSPTIGAVEYSLPGTSTTRQTRTETGLMQACIDLSALQSGDTYVLRVYEKVVAGGTQQLLEQISFSGVQAKPGSMLPAVMLGVGWDVTLQRTAGADRAIPFSIRSVS